MFRIGVLMIVSFIAIGCQSSSVDGGAAQSSESASVTAQSDSYAASNGAVLDLMPGKRFRLTIGSSIAEGAYDLLGAKLLLSHETINGSPWSTVAADVAAGKRNPAESAAATYVEGSVSPTGTISFLETKDAFGNPVPNSALTFSKK